MNEKGTNNAQEILMQGLVDKYLRHRSPRVFENDAVHLDEDTLTAFIEGNITEREAKPVLRHLADCSFCLHITAELIKLDAVFAESTAPDLVSQPSREPVGISDVLSNLLSRIFGFSDSAVTAHEEKKENEDEETETSEKTK